jgi:hypothetical protein
MAPGEGVDVRLRREVQILFEMRQKRVAFHQTHQKTKEASIVAAAKRRAEQSRENTRIIFLHRQAGGVKITQRPARSGDGRQTQSFNERCDQKPER